jgi:hypothetical protein
MMGRRGRRQILFALSLAAAAGEVSLGGCTSPRDSGGLVPPDAAGGSSGDAGAGAALAIDRQVHDYGTVVVSTASADATFVVSNSGGAATGPLTVALTGAAQGFTRKDDRCAGTTVAPGGSCSVVVTVTPTAAGMLSADLSIQASPGGSVAAHLSGTAVTPGALHIAPATQNFGMAVVNNGSATQTFTVTNSGQQATGAVTVSLGGTDASAFVVAADGCSGQLVAAGSTCQITIRFNPGDIGAKAASLAVSANPGGTAVAQVSGTGITAGAVTIAPASHDFGSIQQKMSGSTQTFTVQNTGQAATGALATTLTGNDAGDFTITADGCNTKVLTPSATCTITVQFAPTTAGAKRATLSVTGTPGGTAVSQLSGTALADSSLAIDPTSKDFNSVTISTNGSSFATATFVISNPGGVATGVPSAAVTGTDAGQFSIPAATNGCTAAIPAMGSCMLTVRFAPTATGLKSASLSVTATPGGSISATLAGTGISQGMISISPANQGFGSILQMTNGLPLMFTVTNSGGSATGALATSIVGSTEFQITADGCNQMTLGPANTCTISVRFAPGSAGPKSGTLQVTATPGGTTSAALSGNGLSPALLSINPTSFTFASTVVTKSSLTQTFTVTNTGGVSAGTTTGLSVARGGANPDQFMIVSDTCTPMGTLAAGSSCAVGVAFAPTATATGMQAANLNVSATPGGTAAASLGGTGQTAASLTLAAAPGSTTAFGGVIVNQNQDETFVVTDGGQQGSSALTVNFTTANGSGFSVLPATGGDCVSGSTTLAGGGTCTIRVRFMPGGPGAQSASMGVSATVGGSTQSLTLTGTGLRQAQLSPVTSTVTLNNVEVGVAAGGSVMLSNAGDVTTGAPALSNGDTAEITITTNGCMTALAPGASCTISFTFKPSTGGSRSGSFSLSATPGGTATVTVTATGVYRLTIAKAGTGTGTVTTTTGGITCGATCSALFAPGTMVTVQARTTNGSGSFFSGYSGGGCSGPLRDCTVTITAATTVTATFSPMNNNLIFTTSTAFATNLGSAAAYDAQCNTVASAAGINDAAGASYVAVTSDAATLVSNPAAPANGRLGASARGWVRMDGLPFADSQASLFSFSNAAVFNPIRFDETGAAPNALAQTGAGSDGSTAASENCANFTSTNVSMTMVGGTSESGPSAWIFGTGARCSFTYRLICMGKAKTAAVAPVVTSGRKIWVTNGAFAVGGAMTPNQLCQAQSPAGVTTAAALVATTSQSAASLLDMSMNYVRVDGTLVGSGALISGGGTLASGIWQSGDGVYRPIGSARVWTGAATLTATGTLAGTCGNWADTTQTGGLQGWYQVDDSRWWTFTSDACNDTSGTEGSLYCVQTAP